MPEDGALLLKVDEMTKYIVSYLNSAIDADATTKEVVIEALEMAHRHYSEEEIVQLKTFCERIGTQNWKLNFFSFCKLLGLREDTTDQHSLEMWESFQKLSTGLAKFDVKSLEKLLAPADEKNEAAS